MGRISREAEKELRKENPKSSIFAVEGEEIPDSKNAWNCTDKTPMNMVRVQKGLEIIY